MIVLSEWGLEANTVYMVPARNLVGRLRAHHRTGGYVPS